MSEFQETVKSDNNNPTQNDSANNNVSDNESSDNVRKDDPVSPPSSETGSTSSRIPRQSGLKPPSRIGRPCGGFHKPAIPATPTKNVLEADESEEDGYYDYYNSSRRSALRRKRYSSLGSTASSMEGLWDLHPRRLSEAGLSRHSDSSAVLTEDTDSFMIGQKVWVGGTKPGTIAYIGETQFAPGEWAGIVLDEAIGKNDGSVAGTRYFQCENKKGVFSRLTRLTRMQLEPTGSNETFLSSPSPTSSSHHNNGVVRRSPVSPTGSTRSLLKSTTSMSTSNTSLASTQIDFKIGDRVIIKSTQGSKVGTVRYIGLTDFAPGEWVGVELDDPRGKNDGSVEGKSYFECRPNFGLFAPISKVSKSPSKYKPGGGSCVVHPSPGLPPTGMKRANSKESMASITSKTSVASNVRRVRLGVTSLTPINNHNKNKLPLNTTTPLPTRTALQDVLKEKQQHIEQLLKERDLERAEITRAASQADDAEQKLYNLQREFEHHRAECELKFRENSELVSHLNLDKNEFLAQLEEERRKNEDLLFRFDEAAILHGDFEAVNRKNLTKIEDLEALLKLKSDNAESISNRLFEAEENLIKTRDEVDVLKSELENVRTKRSASEDESSETVSKLRHEIELATKSNGEKSKTIAHLEENIKKFNLQHAEMAETIENLKSKSSATCQEKDEEIEKLRQQLAKSEAEKSQLTTENARLKIELSAKTHDLELSSETIAKHQIDLAAIKTELETKQNDLERHKSNSGESEENLKSELERTRTDLKSKIAEVEDVKKECEVQLAQKKLKLDEANVTIVRNGEELKKLQDELIETKAKFEVSANEVHSRHARAVEDRESQLMALAAEIQQKNEEITKNSIVITKLEDDLCTKNSVIENLRIEIDSVRHSHTSSEENCGRLSSELNALRLAKGDLHRQLEAAQHHLAELIEAKGRLEHEIHMVSKSRCDNSELEALRNEIRQKEAMIESIRAEFLDKLQAAEHARHEIELNANQTAQEYEKALRGFEDKLRVAVETESQLKQKCQLSLEETTQVRDDLMMKIHEHESAIKEKDLHLGNLNGQVTEKEQYYKDQLARVTEELNKNIDGCRDKINALTGETVSLRNEIAKRTEELIDVNARYSHLAEQAHQTENELRQSCAENVRNLQFQLNEKNAQLEQTAQQLVLLRTDCQSSTTDNDAKNRRISELTTEVTRANDMINQLQDQLVQVRSHQQETTTQSDQSQIQCKELLMQVAQLTQKANLVDSLQDKLKTEHDNFLNLLNQLKVTDSQKEKSMRQLQDEIDSTGDGKCKHLMELLRQVQTGPSVDGSAQKIIAFEQELQRVRQDLGEKNAQFDGQKSEILRLQQELLRVQESCADRVPSRPPGGGVGGETNDAVRDLLKPHVTQNPTQMLIQLAALQTSVVDLTTKFRDVKAENNDLLTRLQTLIRKCDKLRGNRDYILSIMHQKQQFSDLDNDLTNDRYKLQHVIQNTLIQLQQKDQQLNHVLKQFNVMQNKLHNLPIQCKQFALSGRDDNNSPVDNRCARISIENDRFQQLLQKKDDRVNELQNIISNLLNDIRNKPNQSDCQPKTIIKNVCIDNNQPRIGTVDSNVAPFDIGSINNDLTSCRVTLTRRETIVYNLKMKLLELNNLISNLNGTLSQCSRTGDQSLKIPPRIIYKQVPVEQPPRIIIKNVCLTPPQSGNLVKSQCQDCSVITKGKNDLIHRLQVELDDLRNAPVPPPRILRVPVAPGPGYCGKPEIVVRNVCLPPNDGGGDLRNCRKTVNDLQILINDLKRSQKPKESAAPEVIVKYVDRNVCIPSSPGFDKQIENKPDRNACRQYEITLNQKDRDLHDFKDKLRRCNSRLDDLNGRVDQCESGMARVPPRQIVQLQTPPKVVIKYVDRNVCVPSINNQRSNDDGSCHLIVVRKNQLIDNLKGTINDLWGRLKNPPNCPLPPHQPPKVVIKYVDRNVCLGNDRPQKVIDDQCRSYKVLINQRNVDIGGLQSKIGELNDLIDHLRKSKPPQSPRVVYVDRNVCQNQQNQLDIKKDLSTCQLTVKQRDSIIGNLRGKLNELNDLISNLNVNLDQCSRNDRPNQGQRVIYKETPPKIVIRNVCLPGQPMDDGGGNIYNSLDNGGNLRPRQIVCKETPPKIVVRYVSKNVCLPPAAGWDDGRVPSPSGDCALITDRKDGTICDLKNQIQNLYTLINDLRARRPDGQTGVVCQQQPPKIIVKNVCLTPGGILDVPPRSHSDIVGPPHNQNNFSIDLNKCRRLVRDREGEISNLKNEMQRLNVLVPRGPQGSSKVVIKYVDRNVCIPPGTGPSPSDQNDSLNVVNSCKVIVNQKDQMINNLRQKISELNSLISNLRVTPNTGPSIDNCRLIVGKNDENVKRLQQNIAHLQFLLNNKDSQSPNGSVELRQCLMTLKTCQKNQAGGNVECTASDLEQNSQVIEQLKHKIVMLQNLLAQFNVKGGSECGVTIDKKNQMISSLKNRVNELQAWIAQLQKQGPSKGFNLILDENQRKIHQLQHTIVELQNLVGRLQSIIANKPTDNCNTILIQNKVLLNERDKKINELQDLIFNLRGLTNKNRSGDQCNLALNKRDQMIEQLRNQLFIQGNLINHLKKDQGQCGRSKVTSVNGDQQVIDEQNRKIDELQVIINNLQNSGSCKLLLSQNEQLLNQRNRRIIELQQVIQRLQQQPGSGDDCKAIIDRNQYVIQQQNYKIKQLEHLIAQLKVNVANESYKVINNKNNQLINQQRARIQQLEDLLGQLQGQKQGRHGECTLLLNKNDILIKQLKQRILELQNVISGLQSGNGGTNGSCIIVENKYRDLLGQQNDKVNQLMSLIAQLKSPQNGENCLAISNKNILLINQQKQKIKELQNLLNNLQGYGCNRQQQIITQQNNRLHELEDLIGQLKSDKSQSNCHLQVNQYQVLISQLRKRIDELQGLLMNSRNNGSNGENCKVDQENNRRLINQQNSKINQLLTLIATVKSQGNNGKSCDENSDLVRQLRQQISLLLKQSSSLHDSINSCNTAFNDNGRLVKRLNDKIYLLQSRCKINSNDGGGDLRSCKMKLNGNQKVIDQQNFKISQLLQLISQLKGSGGNNQQIVDSDLVIQLRSRINDLEHLLNSRSQVSPGDCRMYQQMLDQQKNKVINLEELLANLKGSNNGSNCKIIVERNNNLIAQLQQRIVALQNLLAQSQGSNDISSRLKQCTDAENRLKLRADKDAAKINELNVFISRLQTKIGKGGNDQDALAINQLQQDNGRLRNIIVSLQGNVASCKKVVDGNEKLIDQLNYRVLQLQPGSSDDLENCKAHLNDHQQLLTKLRIELAKLQGPIRNDDQSRSCKLIVSGNEILIKQLKHRIGELEDWLTSRKNDQSGGCQLVLQQNRMLINQQNTKITQLEDIIAGLKKNGSGQCDSGLVNKLQIQITQLEDQLNHRRTSGGDQQCKVIQDRYQEMLDQQDYRINQLQILVSRLQNQNKNSGPDSSNLQLINQQKIQIINLQKSLGKVEGDLKACNDGFMNRERLIGSLNLKIIELQSQLSGPNNVNSDLRVCKANLDKNGHLIRELNVKINQLEQLMSRNQPGGNDRSDVNRLNDLVAQQKDRISQLELWLNQLPSGSNSQSCAYYQQTINQQNIKINQLQSDLAKLKKDGDDNRDRGHISSIRDHGSVQELRNKINELEDLLGRNSGNNYQLYYNNCRADQVRNKKVLVEYNTRINKLLDMINKLRHDSQSPDTNLINSWNQQKLQLVAFQNLIMQLKGSVNNCQSVVSGNEQLINQLNFRIQQLQMQLQGRDQTQENDGNCQKILDQKIQFINDQTSKINQLQLVVDQLRKTKNCNPEGRIINGNQYGNDGKKNKLINDLRMQIIELQQLVTRRPGSNQFNDCRDQLNGNQRFIDQQNYRINQLQVLVNNLQSQLNIAGNCKINKVSQQPDNNLQNLINSLRLSLSTCEKNSNSNGQIIKQLQSRIVHLHNQRQPGNITGGPDIHQYIVRISQLEDMLNGLRLQCKNGGDNPASDQLIDQQRQNIINLEYELSRLRDLVGNCRKGGDTKRIVINLNGRIGELEGLLENARNEASQCRRTLLSNKALINEQETKIGELEQSVVRLQVPDNADSYKVIINRNNDLINQLKNRIVELENMLGKLQLRFGGKSGDCNDVRNQYESLMNQQNHRIAQLQLIISKLKSPDNEGSLNVTINRDMLLINQLKNRIVELENLLQHGNDKKNDLREHIHNKNCASDQNRIRDLEGQLQLVLNQRETNDDVDVKGNLINQQRNEIMMLQNLIHRLEASKDNCALNGNSQTTLQLKQTIAQLQFQLDSLRDGGDNGCRLNLYKLQQFSQHQNGKIKNLQNLIAQLQIPNNAKGNGTYIVNGNVDVINQLKNRLNDLINSRMGEGLGSDYPSSACGSYQQTIKSQNIRINELLNLITHPTINQDSHGNDMLRERMNKLENDLNRCNADLNHDRSLLEDQNIRLNDLEKRCSQRFNGDCNVLVQDYQQQLRDLNDRLVGVDRRKIKSDSGDCASIITEKDRLLDHLRNALNQLESTAQSEHLSKRCLAIIDQNNDLMERQKQRIIELQQFVQKSPVPGSFGDFDCRSMLAQKDQIINQQGEVIRHFSTNGTCDGGLAKNQQLIDHLTNQIRELQGVIDQLNSNPGQFKVILSRNQQLINDQKRRIVELQNIISRLQVPSDGCKSLRDQNNDLQHKFSQLRDLFGRLQVGSNPGAKPSVNKCKYKRIINSLRNQIRRLMAYKIHSHTSGSPSALPLMHVPHPVSSSNQHELSSFGYSRARNVASFVDSLHKVYKHTQEALTNCMDAVMAQKFSFDNPTCNHNYGQIAQGSEFADDQIKFLNSIIVDIQRKNEEQKARIEILESGCSSAFADELKSMDVTQRKIPPRAYCDICEEFDVHETEDCPQQDTELMPPPGVLQGNRSKRDVSKERPYCEICGVFGHYPTDECQEDETY